MGSRVLELNPQSAAPTSSVSSICDFETKGLGVESQGSTEVRDTNAHLFELHGTSEVERTTPSALMKGSTTTREFGPKAANPIAPGGYSRYSTSYFAYRSRSVSCGGRSDPWSTSRSPAVLGPAISR
jgi:hypothetical protein